jgi:hypothetical protein
MDQKMMLIIYTINFNKLLIQSNMTTKTIVSDKGNEYIVPVVSTEEMEQIMFGMDSPGWCLTCGEEVDGVEPDARKYLCECCGERKVYGMEELLTIGLLIIE